MTQLAGWLSSHAAALSIVGVAVTWIVSTILQIAQRRSEADERQFQAFHGLIKRLVSRDRNGGVMYVDRQVAIVFELRHFPRYYDFTERMLVRLKKDWSADSKLLADVVIEEIDLTLRHIQKSK